jgi:hypothetical protein
MNADPRLVTLRLAGNWGRKVERDEMELTNAWELLIERIGATDPKFTACPTCGQAPCPDAAFCASMRSADQKIAASRKCAQCGGVGDLDPHRDNERRRIVYLHASCLRFWRVKHR